MPIGIFPGAVEFMHLCKKKKISSFSNSCTETKIYQVYTHIHAVSEHFSAAHPITSTSKRCHAHYYCLEWPKCCKFLQNCHAANLAWPVVVCCLEQTVLLSASSMTSSKLHLVTSYDIPEEVLRLFFSTYL